MGSRTRRRPIKKDYGAAGMGNTERKRIVGHRFAQMNTDRGIRKPECGIKKIILSQRRKDAKKKSRLKLFVSLFSPEGIEVDFFLFESFIEKKEI